MGCAGTAWLCATPPPRIASALSIGRGQPEKKLMEESEGRDGGRGCPQNELPGCTAGSGGKKMLS